MDCVLPEMPMAARKGEASELAGRASWAGLKLGRKTVLPEMPMAARGIKGNGREAGQVGWVSSLEDKLRAAGDADGCKARWLGRRGEMASLVRARPTKPPHAPREHRACTPYKACPPCHCAAHGAKGLPERYEVTGWMRSSGTSKPHSSMI